MSNNVALDEKAVQQDLTLQIVRVVRAKRERVFDAWTKPELMHQWFAPGTMTVANVQADLRVGGEYRLEVKGADDFTFVASGIYKKIVENELLSFTWGGPCDPSNVDTLVTVKFKDVEGGTELTLTHEHDTSEEAVSKHRHGWTGCLDNLEKFVQ